MKRLAALITVFCLVSTNALAAPIAVLNGGGTGGQFANGSATAATVTTAATTVDIPVGSLAIIAAGMRGGPGVSVTACNDSLGAHNTWSSGSVSNTTTNSTVRVFYSVTTQDMPIGTTVNCTFSSGASINSVVLAAFSGPDPTPFDASANASGSSTGAITIGPVPTAGNLACNAASGEVVIAELQAFNAGTPTPIGSFTSLGNAGNSYLYYQIESSNAAVTFSPTLTGTAGNWAAQIQGFKASTCTSGVIKHGLLLTGVGN